MIKKHNIYIIRLHSDNINKIAFLISCVFSIGKKKGGAQYVPREQDNSEIRKLGNWAAGDWKQTADYTIPVS